jgi:hypothetical protein
MTQTPSYDIDGYLVAYDGPLWINVQFQLSDGRLQLRNHDAPAADSSITIPAEEPAVMHHMDRIASELHHLARQRSSLPVDPVR